MNYQPLATDQSSPGSRPRPDLDEQLEYQSRSRKLKRFGWFCMAVVILSGLAGVFGSGPLSKGKITRENGLELTYRKITRYNAPTHLELVVPPSQNPVEVTINVDFLKSIGIEEVNPEPKEMIMMGNKQRWLFSNEDSSSSTHIEIAYRPERFGRITAEIEVKGAGNISAQQFYLP